jgi:O-antigen/teichoic acid export membrane protein
MRLRRALWFSYLEKYGTYVIALAATMVISRLLGPEDVGVFAVGMALVSIVAVVRELGISVYLVQEDALTNERIRAAFSLALLVGVVLALVVFAASIPAGRYYGDERVTSVLAILAISFVLIPFGGISQSLLSRELRFGILTWIRLLHGLVQGGVGATLAWLGHGPVSLAWAAVAAAAVNSIISFAAHPHSCSPIWRFAELKRVLSVGGPATVVAIIDDILTSVPELVLGRTQGLAAAGLLSRARGLSQLAHQLIARAAGPVFFAAFSARRRDGLEVGPLYVRATICVTTLGWALLIALAALAQPVVSLLFGPAWLEVVPLIRWLVLAAAIALLTSGANHLLMATGAANALLRAKLMSVPIFVAVVAIGSLYGVQGVCIGLVFGTAVSSVLLGRAVVQECAIDWRRQLEPVRLGAPVALATGLGCIPGMAIGSESLGVSAAALALGGAGGLSAGGLTLFAMNAHPLREEAVKAWVQLSGRDRKRSDL